MVSCTSPYIIVPPLDELVVPAVPALDDRDDEPILPREQINKTFPGNVRLSARTMQPRTEVGEVGNLRGLGFGCVFQQILVNIPVLV